MTDEELIEAMCDAAMLNKGASWQTIMRAALAVVREAWGKDAERLDWLETKSDGSDWIARESGTGRGYRLHNTGRGSTGITARAAIDAARAQEKQS